MKKIRIRQLKINAAVCGAPEAALKEKIAKKLRIHINQVKGVKILRRSVDARKKPDIYYVYTVDVEAEGVKNSVFRDPDIEHAPDCPLFVIPDYSGFSLKKRPVIAGFGPAGMFCAYMFAKSGLMPVVLERGSDVECRVEKVRSFWETGMLDTQTNVQFGEGGAGTFSDGKLNTGIRDSRNRNRFVLETLHEFGAPASILSDARPHIGTDILCDIVKNMRGEIIRCGGQILFESALTDISLEDGAVRSVTINGRESLECDTLIFATGHSARDTFAMLKKKNISMEAKPFAVGVRIEHPRRMINEAVYGKDYPGSLPAASYRLAEKSSSNRGVYSFCMCPGGYVINASSEGGMTAVNGMSYSERSARNSNSAIIVTVSPSDFLGDDPLRGVAFQRDLERKAFVAGNGRIPVQTFMDFKRNKETSAFGEILPDTKGGYLKSNIRGILPDFVSLALEECIPKFSSSICGFDRDDAVLSAVESRTSSPVRILRNGALESVSAKGLYPCGEGAGYAGGIVSAAIDGIRVFEAVTKRFKS